jgi:hypothetical protein
VRVLVLGFLALTLLVVGGLVAWRLIASYTLNRVDVRVSNYACRGDGAEVRSNPRRITVKPAEDMRCIFNVRVKNRSQLDVHLGDARADEMGPDKGPELRAESIDGGTPRGDDLNVDALYSLDRSVPSGDSAAFDIVVVFNREGCPQIITRVMFHFPQVEVSTLGVERTIGGHKALAYHNTIRNPDCDRFN